MEKEKLKAYGIDYENAVKRFAGNEALYEKFLVKLTKDDHLAIGEQALAEGRYEDVLEAVHALKGVAGTLGMTDLFEAASQVVASIRKQELSHLPEQMAKVRAEFEKACEAVS
jgi:HPt (histidine-containing phosphotransfer) domain-containing protein